ncbi:hypothetical protein D4R42_04785 [bacterium]|nr:MAG: hypothetical protein D4R42_04785 [bacterium]
MKRYWTDDEITRLIILRAEHVAFDLIAKELGRTTNACHTKYYSLMSRAATSSRMEVRDPARSAFNRLDKLKTRHRDAIGRAILRNKGMEVDGLQVDVSGTPYPYVTVIGPHALLSGDKAREAVIAWLLPSGESIVLLPWSAYSYEYDYVEDDYDDDDE